MTTMTHVPTRTTGRTAVALLVLWLASFGASYLHLGALALPVALLIAGAKVILVTLFFMELAVERFQMAATVLTAFTLIMLLIGLMVGDIRTRATPPLRPPLVSPLVAK
ncbi:MAG: cytochrome C oxidase subunit IV family protein [Polyangiaceae bacterium]